MDVMHWLRGLDLEQYASASRAHEDDAERAVRAGLNVLSAITRLRTPAGEPLQVRIGVATGQVVIGDLIGEGAAREQAGCWIGSNWRGKARARLCWRTECRSADRACVGS